MFARLFLLFSLVPLVELAILIEVGRHIGVFNTIALVVLTALAGAFLARSQGFQVLHRIRGELDEGRLPTASLLDGGLVLAGGLLLLTPGVLTDALGFALLIPVTRNLCRRYLKKLLQKQVQKQSFYVEYRIDDRDS